MAAADKGVLAIAANDDVVVVAADQDIVAGPAVDHVVALEAVERSDQTKTVSVLPVLEVTEEGKFLNIPAEAGYSVTRRPVDPLMDQKK